MIERSLDAADVQLVVIGKDWLTATDDLGRRRLDNADDYVAREVEVGLAKAIRVIPILADNATMPHAADLPNGCATSRPEMRAPSEKRASTPTSGS